jgi:hypothetical protein
MRLSKLQYLDSSFGMAIHRRIESISNGRRPIESQKSVFGEEREGYDNLSTSLSQNLTPIFFITLTGRPYLFFPNLPESYMFWEMRENVLNIFSSENLVRLLVAYAPTT